MAPSVQQLAEDVPEVSFEKLSVKEKEPVKVKRQIEEEGGKTDASVCLQP